ncbi:MAG: UDP-3-O-(3-hydroxymyristoyl)glucosamine N-acyltransferase [Deltaproteobacteria bacterium]|nr:UDP-3-O-(3-hydroxymyristoyl)glucosamine N-acyltransferase [Deltaproteobacteria bacterium]
MKISIKDIAGLIGGEIQGDPSKIICGAAPFENAQTDEITFAGNAKLLKKIDQTRAGAVIVPKKVPKKFQTSEKELVLVDNPNVAFTKILSLFYPSSNPGYFTKNNKGISADARIGENLKCGLDMLIGPFAVIGKNVTLGDRVILHPGVVIGDDVTIGDDVRIYPNVTIYDRCGIGNRVIIHAGTVIGSDGFGFAPDGVRYHKIIHTGLVRIEDDVEIGANNTIDRGTFGETVIKQGVKTDNLVHIAHNVIIGENSVVVAQVGISGSTTIGKNAILAGQAGIAGHLKIGDNVTIGPRAGIAKPVPDGSIVSGAPEMPHRLWLKVQNILPKLPELKKKLIDIEKRLKKIEKN